MADAGCRRPATVACSEQPKSAPAFQAQPRHELPNLDHRLAQSVAGQDEIGRATQLATEVAGGRRE